MSGAGSAERVAQDELASREGSGTSRTHRSPKPRLLVQPELRPRLEPMTTPSHRQRLARGRSDSALPSVRTDGAAAGRLNDLHRLASASVATGAC